MSENDYQTGYRGGQYHHGMDRGEYERGQGQKDLENTLSGGGGGGSASSKSSGTALGLILMAPFMFIVYPAGGILFLGTLGSFVYVMNWFNVHDFTVMMSTIALGFGTIFLGLWVERKVTQFGIYRALRLGWRIIIANGLLMKCVLVGGTNSKGVFEMDLAIKNANTISGAMLGAGVTIAVAFWLISRADRIYFPVDSQLAKEAELEKVRAAAPVKPKGKMKRFMSCLAWFIPVALGAHLIIRFAIDAYFGSTQSDPDIEGLRRAFYHKNLIFIYIADVAAWFLLSITGLLPGTGKK